MKNILLTTFGNVFNDLRALIWPKLQPTKIETPKRAPKNAPIQTIPRKRNGKSSIIKSKNKSMTDSQGVPKFSGSGYNGQGAPDHGKIRSNRKRR